MKLCSNKYNIQEIKKIQNSNFTYIVKEDIKDIIIDIATKLGKKITKVDLMTILQNNINNNTSINNENIKGNNTNKSNHRGNHHSRHSSSQNKYDNNITSDFKCTKPIVVEKDEIDKKMNDMRNNLNKLTDKNYPSISSKIINIIDEVNNSNENETSDNEINMYKIGNLIFETATNNIFYSKIYAILYSELFNKYEVMKIIFNDNFKEYYKIFENIEYVNNSENYDKFCEINKINQKRKSLSTFILNLAKNDIISKDALFKIIVKLMTDVLDFIKLTGKENEVNEIIDNIFILLDLQFFENFNEIQNGLLFMNSTKSFMDVINILVSSTDQINYPSFSKKSKFKLMDIIGS